jgi:hypothetical protein
MSESHPTRWASLLSGYGLPLLACIGAVVTAILVSHDGEHSISARNVAVAVAIVSLLTALFQHFCDVANDKEVTRLKQLLTGGDSFLMAYFPFADGKHWLTLRHFGTDILRDMRVEIAAFDPHRILAAFVYPSMLRACAHSNSGSNAAAHFRLAFKLQMDGGRRL